MARWLQPKDYESEEQLFSAVKLILLAVGTTWYINYKTLN